MRFLRACVAEPGHLPDVERTRALSHEGLVDAEVLDIILRHRIAGCALNALRQYAPDSALLPSVGAVARSAVALHLRTLMDVQSLAGPLSGVPWLVVKGPVLAGYAYPRPDMRVYGDLDVLVAPQDLGRAVTALETAGFTVLDRNWDLFVRDLPGEVHLRTPSGGMLDLHWHIQNDRKSRDRAHIQTADLLRRRRFVTLGGMDVPTLDEVDSLLHVLVHAARSGGHRLVWLKDAQQLWQKDQPDPALVVQRAKEWGVELAVMIMLQRSQRALCDASLGRAVLAGLDRRRTWGRFFRLVDRLAPVERAGEGSSPTRLLARAVAADPPHAAREGIRRVVFGLRNLRDSESPDKTWDPTNPHAIVFESGGAVQRAAYFAAVASRACS